MGSCEQARQSTDGYSSRSAACAGAAACAAAAADAAAADAAQSTHVSSCLSSKRPTRSDHLRSGPSWLDECHHPCECCARATICCCVLKATTKMKGIALSSQCTHLQCNLMRRKEKSRR